MIVCIVSLILLSSGGEYVKTIGIKSKVLSKHESQWFVRLDASDLAKWNLADNPLNRARRWVFEEQCYDMPDGIAY